MSADANGNIHATDPDPTPPAGEGEQITNEMLDRSLKACFSIREQQSNCPEDHSLFGDDEYWDRMAMRVALESAFSTPWQEVIGEAVKEENQMWLDTLAGKRDHFSDHRVKRVSDAFAERDSLITELVGTLKVARRYVQAHDVDPTSAYALSIIDAALGKLTDKDAS